MKVQNPKFRELATAIFYNANFINNFVLKDVRDLPAETGRGHVPTPIY